MAEVRADAWLSAFVAEYDDPRGAAALRALAEFLQARGVSPFAADAQDLAAFVADGLPRCSARVRDAYRTALRALYAEAFDQGRAPAWVALAGGVDPIELSPDRALLLAFVDRHGPSCLLAMRQLAAFFAASGRGPLAANPQELHVLLSVRLRGRKTHRRWVAIVYRELVEQGRVELPVALAAGADPIAISPDRVLLEAFVADQGRGSYHCRAALRWAAGFFAARAKGPSTATGHELRQLAGEGYGGLAPTTRARYLTWLRSWYLHHPRQGTPAAAIFAHVDPIDASPDRFWLTDFIVGAADPAACRPTVRLLARHCGDVNMGPLTATPYDLERLWRQLGRAGRRRHEDCIRLLYEQALAQGLVTSELAYAGGVDPIAASPDRELLQRFVAARSDADADAVREALRPLARRFHATPGGLCGVTADELARFRRDVAGAAAEWTERLYAWLSARGEISPSLAVAAGVDPLRASPDRRRLERFLSRRERPVRWLPALRALAAFFARSDRGPLAATPEEVERVRSQGLPGGYVAGYTRVGTCVAAFYGEALCDRLVSYAVAHAARADVLHLTPDSGAVAGYLASCPASTRTARRKPLKYLAAYFLRIGKGPLTATAIELRALCDDAMAGQWTSTRIAYLRTFAAFYAAIDAPELAAAVTASPAIPTTALTDAVAVRSFVDRHGGHAGSALWRLGTILERRGTTVLAATVDDVAAFRTVGRRELQRPTLGLYMYEVRIFYREQLAAGRIGEAVAIAAGLPPRDVCPRHWEWRRFVAENAQEEYCSTVLERLADYLEQRGTHPLAAPPDVLRDFLASPTVTRLSVGRAAEYPRWVAAFYGELRADGLVSPSQALAAGVDPVMASPDRDVLLASMLAHAKFGDYAGALRRVAAAYARDDRGPLEATATEMATFADDHLADNAASTRRHRERLIARFYVEQAKAGRVTPRVALAAGGDPIALSPDRRELREHLAEHRGGGGCTTALTRLARFFLERDKGPLAATTVELRLFGPGHVPGHERWIGRFYETHFMRGRVSLEVAAFGGADPLAISPDREQLNAFLARRSSNVANYAIRVLGRQLAMVGKGPLAATRPDVERIYHWLWTRYGSDMATTYWRIIGDFYVGEHNAGRVPRWPIV